MTRTGTGFRLRVQVERTGATRVLSTGSYPRSPDRDGNRSETSGQPVAPELIALLVVARFPERSPRMGLGQPKTGNGIDPCGTIRQQEEVTQGNMGNHDLPWNRNLFPKNGGNRVRATVRTFLRILGSGPVLPDERGNPIIR
jgi:hypothetical protein